MITFRFRRCKRRADNKLPSIGMIAIRITPASRAANKQLCLLVFVCRTNRQSVGGADRRQTSGCVFFRSTRTPRFFVIVAQRQNIHMKVLEYFVGIKEFKFLLSNHKLRENCLGSIYRYCCTLPHDMDVPMERL